MTAPLHKRVRPRKRRGQNSTIVRAGIEVEGFLIDARGEIVADARHIIKDLKDLKDSGGFRYIEVSSEVANAMIEIRTSQPLGPRELKNGLDEMAKLNEKLFSQYGVVFVPLAVAPLPPLLGDGSDDNNRGFTLNKDPEYAPSLAIQTSSNDLSVCSTHIHASMWERLTNQEALELTMLMRAFTPWFLALSASSPLDMDGEYKDVASQRWARWASIPTVFFHPFGKTYPQYQSTRQRFTRQRGLGKDPNPAARMHAPIRPTTRDPSVDADEDGVFGTSELRIADGVTSSTERRLLSQLFMGLIQSAANPNADLRRIGAKRLQAESKLAGNAGMYPFIHSGIDHDPVKHAKKRSSEGEFMDPLSGNWKAMTEVNDGILEFLKDALEDQGTWDQVLKDFNVVRRWGTGAARQWQDISNIHQLCQAAEIPGSEYSLEQLLTKSSPQMHLSKTERLLLQRVTAFGAFMELDKPNADKRRDFLVDAVNQLSTRPEKLPRYTPVYQFLDNSFDHGTRFPDSGIQLGAMTPAQ